MEMTEEAYVCPGCGKVHYDYEDYSYCKEYHGDHPDTITTPKQWAEYCANRYDPNKEYIAKRDYEMNTGRKAYYEGMADW